MNGSLRAALAVATTAVLMAAGCGDDDDSGGSTPSPTSGGQTSTTEAEDGPAGADADVAAYCQATLALETLPEPSYDLEIPGAAGNWVTQEVQPVVAEMVAAAPEEIAEDLDTLAAAVDSVATSSDLSEFGTDEVDAAEANIHTFDLDSCGWDEQPITATEYRFDGVSGALESGPVSFEISNEGSEVHELVLQRKNEGVTESAAELAALPAGEAEAKLTDVGSVIVEPGSHEYKVFDLQAGEYIIVCFVPVGTTSMDSEELLDGTPHYVEGMLAELTVN